MAKRRVGSIRSELIRKSREAALSAIQTFNNPLIQFKSETYIVLMVIAWTYLLHAHYRSIGIDYRYYDMKGSRKRYHRTKYGAYKHWDLDRCLNDKMCPLDAASKANLRFLILLRHEIEHQMTLNLDNYLSGRYQACALNYCHFVRKLFGKVHGIEHLLTYSLQFVQFSHHQATGIPMEDEVPERLKAFIIEFDNSLTDVQINDERYSYRLLFTKTNVNRVGQADRVIEFVSPDSELANAIEKEYWVRKEVERRKHLPSKVVKLMKGEGYTKFNAHHHTILWKERDAKAPNKGLGVQVESTWYWYDPWVDIVRDHCAENEQRYREREKVG